MHGNVGIYYLYFCVCQYHLSGKLLPVALNRIYMLCVKCGFVLSSDFYCENFGSLLRVASHGIAYAHFQGGEVAFWRGQGRHENLDCAGVVLR